MSRFTKRDAERLARDAFRRRLKKYPSVEEQKEVEGNSSAPLLGKEDELLSALQDAETIYDEWRLILGLLENIRESDERLIQQCKKLATHLERAMTCLSEMDGFVREEFESLASPSSIEQLKRSLKEILELAELGATWVPEAKPRPGRPADIAENDVEMVPLEEFAKAIRKFWVDETGLKFSFDDSRWIKRRSDSSEPTSAAARLLFSRGQNPR